MKAAKNALKMISEWKAEGERAGERSAVLGSIRSEESEGVEVNKGQTELPV